MSYIGNILVPVLLDAKPRHIPLMLSYYATLGVEAHAFTRMKLAPRLSKRRFHPIRAGWSDEFVASVLSDFSAGFDDGKMLYLIPCSVFAVELIGKARESLGQNFIICNKIPDGKDLPIPPHIPTDLYNE